MASWVLEVVSAIEHHTELMAVDFYAAAEATKRGYEMLRKSVNVSLFGAVKLNVKCATIDGRSISAIKSYIEYVPITHSYI